MMLQAALKLRLAMLCANPKYQGCNRDLTTQGRDLRLQDRTRPKSKLKNLFSKMSVILCQSVNGQCIISNTKDRSTIIWFSIS